MSMIYLTNSVFLSGIETALQACTDSEMLQQVIGKIKSTSYLTIDQHHFIDAVLKHEPRSIYAMPESYLAKLLF